jgi:predicted nucleotidyltransferase component of viral defense system
MRIPLYQKLRKKSHKDIALAQDILIIELYKKFPDAVIHGGTAIWRCYGSNRFSEDVDVYLPKKYKNKETLEDFFEQLKASGLELIKFKLTNTTLFSKLIYGEVEIRLEAVFKEVKSVLKSFELTDGNSINVLTLSAEDFILEKILAYKKRKMVRDLYDIYFLLSFVSDKEKINKKLKDFIENIEKPLDEKNLPVLIISGVSPKVDEMIKVIKAWVK